MEFLKIYDVTNYLYQLEKENEICSTVEGYILNYYIQPDVHDYHVYRIVKGSYDEEYEGREDQVLTVEHQKISKWDVLEVNGTAASSREQRDKRINGLPTRKLIDAVIKLDDEDGMSNWDYKVVENLDDAIMLITDDDFYKVIKFGTKEAV